MMIGDSGDEHDDTSGRSVVPKELPLASDTTTSTVIRRQGQDQATTMVRLRESAERLNRLQFMSEHLAAALTIDDVVSVVVRTFDHPTWAEVRALWLLDAASDELHLTEHFGMQPEAEDRFRTIDLSEDLPGAVAVRERRTIISPSRANGIRHFPLLEGVPRTSEGFAVLPLVVGSTSLGVIAFGFSDVLNEGEVEFLEAAARNIAQTLQRVRLTEALQRRSEEIGLLGDLARSAIAADDFHNLMQRIVDILVQRMGAICIMHLVPEPGSLAMEVIAHNDLPRSWADKLSRAFSPDPANAHGIARVMQTGEPEIIHGSTSDIVEASFSRAGMCDPDIELLLADLDLSSSITFPIRSEGRTFGALQVITRGEARARREGDAELARGLTTWIGDALADRWQIDQSRRISTTLQEAFLPPALPSVPGTDVAAAYWPAGTAGQVGGDFYDLFAIADDRWAVLIGDACGTGPDAAATAAIARHTTRAAARHGLDHREVLEWVNQAVKFSDRNLYCTACYATIHARPDDNVIDIVLCTAGHPLPVMVGAGCSSSLGVPGTLLGVFDDPKFSVTRHHLHPGDAVVFYSDGLTDLPGLSALSERDLRNLLAGQEFRSADDLLQILRSDLDRRVASRVRADDVAVLVLMNSGIAPASRNRAEH